MPAMDEMPGNLAQGFAVAGGALATLLVCSYGLHMTGGQSALTAVVTAVALLGVTSLLRNLALAVSRGGTPPQS